MKIARFVDADGMTRYGRIDVSDGQVLGGEAEPIAGDIFAAPTPTGTRVRIRQMLCPVDPPNVIAIGLNYRDHARESNMPIPEFPVVFLKATTAVIGPAASIVIPRVAPDEVDYEGELAVVIGKTCKDVDPEHAGDYILGYTCGNDVSARDCQLKIDRQWARAKSFDTFCPLGPWLVTGDEFDPGDVAIRTRLNGRTVQESRTSQLIFPVPALVSFLSRQMTLRPGTVILTGTPSGVGFARKPPLFLKSGDRVVVEIEGIGPLDNPVA